MTATRSLVFRSCAQRASKCSNSSEPSWYSCGQVCCLDFEREDRTLRAELMRFCRCDRPGRGHTFAAVSAQPGTVQAARFTCSCGSACHTTNDVTCQSLAALQHPALQPSVQRQQVGMSFVGKKSSGQGSTFRSMLRVGSNGSAPSAAPDSCAASSSEKTHLAARDIPRLSPDLASFHPI